jgi:hypothetical protein
MQIMLSYGVAGTNEVKRVDTQKHETRAATNVTVGILELRVQIFLDIAVTVGPTCYSAASMLSAGRHQTTICILSPQQ